jgi:hypothetical protein
MSNVEEALLATLTAIMVTWDEVARVMSSGLLSRASVPVSLAGNYS